MHSNSRGLVVQRASQCESVAPIAAYYTRYAGMMKGLEFKAGIHPDIQAVLVAMMSKLEQDKSKMGLAGSGEGDAAKKADEEEELRAFALKVFAIADRTDQMGARDAKLLNKYMSARTFLQAYQTVLDDRPLPAKESELLKYCSVRCYQISKALKSGVASANTHIRQHTLRPTPANYAFTTLYTSIESAKLRTSNLNSWAA